MAKDPCIGVCKFSRKTGLCKECLRTRDEKPDFAPPFAEKRDCPKRFLVSPDGRNVYVTSFVSDAVAVLARDRKRHLSATR